MFRRDPTPVLLAARRQYGDVARFRIGAFETHLVSHPELIRRVLVERHRDYVRGPAFDELELVLGKGLLTTRGYEWREQRRRAQPAFHHERLNALVPVMGETVAARCQDWLGAHGRGEIDLRREMLRLTLSIVGRAFFGVDLGHASDGLGQALTTALDYVNGRLVSPVRFPRSWKTPGRRRALDAVARLDAQLLPLVRGRSEGDGPDLLSLLREARDERTGEPLQERALRDQVVTLAVSGHETTASALSFVFLVLAKHPELEARVIAEARAVVGDGIPKVEALSKLVFTKMVIEETLRLYPPVWFIDRRAAADDVLAGHPIRAGSFVIISPFVVHRHSDLWSRPDVFDPERFAPATRASVPRYGYIPFGAGPHQCIGGQFAMFEMLVVISMVLARCRLEPRGSVAFELEPKVALHPRGTFAFSVTKR